MERVVIVDLRDYGGVADGVTDNHDAFISAAQAAKGGAVYMPSGTWHFASTLDLTGGGTRETSYPVGIIGDGRRDSTAGATWGGGLYPFGVRTDERPDTAVSTDGHGTVITWGGGGTNFIESNGNRLTIRDIFFDGNDTTRCAAFYGTKWLSGYGASLVEFKNVTINNCDYFFFTDSLTNAIQSDCTFSNCIHRYGIDMVKINHSFGVNYLLNFCIAQDLSNSALNFPNGGNVVANMFSLKDVAGYALENTASWSGDGSGDFAVFNGLYWDSSSAFQKAFYLRGGNVVVNGMVMNNSGHTHTAALIDMNGTDATLTVNGGQFAQRPTTSFPILDIAGASSGQVAHAEFNRCQFGPVAATLTDVDQFVTRGRYARVRVNGCKSGTRYFFFEPQGEKLYYNTADFSGGAEALSCSPVSTVHPLQEAANYYGFRIRIEAGTFETTDSLEVQIKRVSTVTSTATIATQTVAASGGADQEFHAVSALGGDDFHSGDTIAVSIDPDLVASVAGLRVSVHVYWSK